MKIPQINHYRCVRNFAISFALLGGLCSPGTNARADDPAPQELLQGPLHEAFGQPVAFNPQPGVIVATKPPDAIEEMPPDQKPDGDNVVWVGGYWSWDDQQKDFIWISGFWRAVPPGRTWVPGYWSPSGGRFQWVSGYWASAQSPTQEYLPQPPATLESGPSTQAPSTDVIWTPGCWVWRETRYLWRPGFWVNAQPDWVWVPASYAWTPSGYIFVNGYWDYAIHRRGLLFAPVLFPRVYLTRPKFVYTPTVVVDLGILSAHLFIRPAQHHYYFGDYYAADFIKIGIYPWFSFHNSRFGFDPLFAHASWVYRKDEHWLPNLKEQYWARRDTVAARPPHTFAALKVVAARPNAPKEMIVAHTLTDVTRLKSSPVPLRKVEPARLNEFRQYAKETHNVVQERAKFESRKVVVEPKAPVKWDLPKRTSTVIAATPKGKGPPKSPAIPEHRAEPPKVKGGPLPHPEDLLKRPAKK
jgi:hypothetical protein